MSRLRTAALTALVVILAYIALAYPDLFLLVAVVGQFVWLVIVHAQRDEIAAKWAEAVFAQRSAEHRAETLAGDYDAVVKRLAEISEEHANCPAPIVAVAR